MPCFSRSTANTLGPFTEHWSVILWHAVLKYICSKELLCFSLFYFCLSSLTLIEKHISKLCFTNLDKLMIVLTTFRRCNCTWLEVKSEFWKESQLSYPFVCLNVKNNPWQMRFTVTFSKFWFLVVCIYFTGFLGGKKLCPSNSKLDMVRLVQILILLI